MLGFTFKIGDTTHTFYSTYILQLISSKMSRIGDTKGRFYTMDHEVGPWKMAFLNGMSSRSNFHGPIYEENHLESLGCETT